MRRRNLLGSVGAGAVLTGLGRPAVAQPVRTLRFVPQVDLANADPVWNTATVATNHGYMVWDTLYGIDNSLTPRPQMVDGHTVSDDGLTWEFTLREGLLFHDGTPVRAVDCTTSIDRWSQRNPLGAQMMRQTAEMKPLDDRRFRIQLTSPFRQMLFSLGAGGCFVMPERLAKTPGSQQVTEYLGSGPFRFVRDEWVAGSRAVYAKFDGYKPRAEKPEWFSGGKVVNFDRVEWIVMPDPATRVAALQQNEVDWLEQPLIDLVPLLRSSPGVTVASYDKLGVLAMVVVNHLIPPFDNPAILKAILSATSQADCVGAVVGEETSLGVVPAGFFVEGSPAASRAGMEALTSPRSIAAAKAAIVAAGYKGERIVLMGAQDQPNLMTITQVTRELWVKLGLNVDFQVMDWATLVARRAKQDGLDQAGWSAWCTTWSGLPMASPGTAFPLQAIGRKGWIGWYSNPAMAALLGKWFDAPDVAAQKAVCQEMQTLAFENPPFIPLGQWKAPWAFRKTLSNFVECGNILFWGVRKA